MSSADPSELRKNIFDDLTNLVKSAKIASGVFRQGYRWDDGTRINSVRRFRELLFWEELDSIGALLEKITEIEDLKQIRRLVSGLSDLFKSGRYVASNAFRRGYRGKVEEILGQGDTPYSRMLGRALKIAEAKLGRVKEAERVESPPSATSELMVFLTSFAMACLLETLESGLDLGFVEEIIAEFHADFVYAYSFVESKAHTVVVLGDKASDVFPRVKRLIESYNARHDAYLELKKHLKKSNYEEYDIRHPVPRKLRLFGRDWDSLILVAYPEAAKGAERILTEEGVSLFYRRLASVLYLELILSKERDEMLIVVNRPKSELEGRTATRRVLDDIFTHLVGPSFTAIYGKRQEVFSVDAAKLVERVEKTLRPRARDRLDKALQQFEEDLKSFCREILEGRVSGVRPFEHKERLLKFVETLRLSELRLQLQKGMRPLMSVAVFRLGEDRLLPEKGLHRLSSAVRIVAEEASEEHETPEEVQSLVVVGLEGRLEEATVITEPSRIEFTSQGDVRFHNMRRDHVTELSYLLHVVSEKWGS